MAEQHPQSVTGQPESPLIGVPVEQQGHERVVYFVDEDDADQALQQHADRPAIKLAGVWRDLDADDMLTELDRLRHETKPTPPVTSLQHLRRYLLDTGPLAAYLLGRPRAVSLIDPWLDRHEAATSILVYGEVIEYLKDLPDFPLRRGQLRQQLQEIRPYFLTYAIVERYTDIRRSMRKPHGAGLIGDVDTLIAATAMERGLTVVTADSDFTRVPGLAIQLVAVR